MKLTCNEVRIENTTHCNAKCTICPRDKFVRTKTTMPYYHFENLVRQSKRLGADTISLFGYGEPLMDPTLPRKVALCTKLGLKTNLTTNASLLTEGLTRKLLENGLGEIRFSCHGWGDNYEKVHRGLKWYKVSHHIGEFMKTNDVMGHPCKVHIIVIPMHGETVEEIIAKWEPGGEPVMRVDYLEVWKPHGWAGSKDYRKIIPKKKSCGRPFRGPIQINADGAMMVCCFDINGELTVGSTYEHTIEYLLKSKEFERIREAHRTGDMANLPCENCDQRNIELESPLLYSTLDSECKVGKTSSTKFLLEA